MQLPTLVREDLDPPSTVCCALSSPDWPTKCSALILRKFIHLWREIINLLSTSSLGEVLSWPTLAWVSILWQYHVGLLHWGLPILHVGDYKLNQILSAKLKTVFVISCFLRKKKPCCLVLHSTSVDNYYSAGRAVKDATQVAVILTTSIIVNR